jgi:hypothetical protein
MTRLNGSTPTSTNTIKRYELAEAISRHRRGDHSTWSGIGQSAGGLTEAKQERAIDFSSYFARKRGRDRRQIDPHRGRPPGQSKTLRPHSRKTRLCAGHPNDGLEALDRAKEGRFRQIIFMDNQMPRDERLRGGAEAAGHEFPPRPPSSR